jgi:alkanesulfonate monooxygenase SsuD/methylene tetrahydromethanopterin reductase-like flavin-dependent oxidoreductase (luciferase family)
LPELNLGVLFDMRNPDRPDRSFEQHYAQVLDQIVTIEGLGYDSAWVTEHHCTDDGYAPAPLILLTAMSQRAPSLAVGTNVVLAPLHHPLRLAEDAATLACITNGRFTLGLGGGYSPQEFGAFGVSLRNRPSLVTETFEILRLAFTGEVFSYEGKRHRIVDGQVTPKPATPPRLFLGALSLPAAERAVRIADGFMGAWPASLEFYTQALVNLGQQPTDGAIGGMPLWWVVAEDPEREWARVGDHALYQMNRYVDWGAFGEGVPHFAHRDQLLEAGVWSALDAPAAIAQIAELLNQYPQLQDIHFFNTLPGEDVDSGTARLEYLASKVLPAVREHAATG